MATEIQSGVVIKSRNSDFRARLRQGPGPEMISAKTLTGDDVFNNRGENLGEIKDIILDTRNGKIGYAVLSFGSFLGMNEKLFAVPWNALLFDASGKRFILDAEISELKNAPGFDRGRWPDMTNPNWASNVHSYYRAPLYYDPQYI